MHFNCNNSKSIHAIVRIYVHVNLRSNFRTKAEKGHGREISFLYREQAFLQGTHTEHSEETVY